MRRRWLVASPLVLALSGCDQVLGIESGTVSPWFCNANVAPPSGMTSYDFHLVNSQMQPIPLGTPLFCPNSGPPCASPSLLSLTSGTLDFTVPASDDGYIDLPNPTDVSNLVELGPPGNVAPTERTFVVFKGTDVTTFASSVGITEDSTKGALVVAAYDCNEMPADGVSIAVTVEGRPVMSSPYYLTSNLTAIPSATATSSAGLALVANVMPSDAATVTLARASDQVVVATAPVHVRAQTITSVYLGPTRTQ